MCVVCRRSNHLQALKANQREVKSRVLICHACLPTSSLKGNKGKYLRRDLYYVKVEAVTLGI